jgi:peptidoglycan-associated lipoprotein
MKKILWSALLVSLLAACSSTKTPGDASSQNAMGLDSSSSGGMLNGGGSNGNPLQDPNNILSQRSVYFDFDAFTVTSQYHDMLDAHAKYLSGNRTAHIAIQGNTDNRGTAEYNLALGQKRAEAVKRTLTVLGVGDSQIETVSFGKERPLDESNSDAAWAKNRRADIVYAGE